VKENVAQAQKKYDKDGPFNDPVVRCYECDRLILTAKVKQVGKCPFCGTTKVKEVRTFNLREYLKMRFWWRVDAAWLALFSGKGAAHE
jgi:uncharacterized CHY-type Zn-finger protein